MEKKDNVDNEELKADKKEAEIIEVRKDLKFSLNNSTNFDLKNVTIGLPDTVLTYEVVKKQSQTVWVNVPSAYHYGFVRFFDWKDRKYYIQPIDYVGETSYKKGEMKFVIKSIDTLNQNFELDFDYRHN
ncbi:hypothetical protein [Gramella sp. Hel_I_59]|uniref:hypothetical protein n=1 Tax=Gramella sp. Hel_I_59 TaxID=1249978 RepID=UPI00115251BA|nr:hypothetical protein [Gramella sp. Hel_I_59]